MALIAGVDIVGDEVNVVIVESSFRNNRYYDAFSFTIDKDTDTWTILKSVAERIQQPVQFSMAVDRDRELRLFLDIPLRDMKKIEAVLPSEIENIYPDSAEGLQYDFIRLKRGVFLCGVTKEYLSEKLKDFKDSSFEPHTLTSETFAVFSLFKEGKENTMLISLYKGRVVVVYLDKEGIIWGRSEYLCKKDRIDTYIIKNIRTIKSKIGAWPEKIIFIGDPESDLENIEKAGIEITVHKRFTLTGIELDSKFVIAAGLALSRLKSQNDRIEFRKGDFTYHGEYDYLGSYIKKTLIFIAGLILVLFLRSIATSYTLSAKEKDQLSELRNITNRVLGKEYTDFRKALAVMRSDVTPKEQKDMKPSVLDVLGELLLRIPKKADIKIVSIDISPESLRFEGSTNKFENVDLFVNALKGYSRISEIKKGRVGKSFGGTGIKFKLLIKLKQGM